MKDKIYKITFISGQEIYCKKDRNGNFVEAKKPEGMYHR